MSNAQQHLNLDIAQLTQILDDFATEWHAVAPTARQAAPAVDFTQLDALANQGREMVSAWKAQTSPPGTSGVTASDTTGATGTTIPGQSGTTGITSLTPGASGTVDPHGPSARPADAMAVGATGTGGANEANAPTPDNAVTKTPAADTTAPAGTLSASNPTAATPEDETTESTPDDEANPSTPAGSTEDNPATKSSVRPDPAGPVTSDANSEQGRA